MCGAGARARARGPGYTAFGSGVSTEIGREALSAAEPQGYTAFGSGVSTEMLARGDYPEVYVLVTQPSAQG